MQNIRVCVVGCGNITINRHLPALKKLNIKVIGAICRGININNKKILEKKYSINNIILLDEKDDDESIEKTLLNTNWFNEVDAVICGLPPKEHYRMAMIFIKLGKHVLMEKPFTLTSDEAKKIIEFSTIKNIVVNVVHNFQYANGMIKLENIIKNNELGNIKSVLEFQISNRYRRLPSWYQELPLGLFYDEASHFFYTINKLFGKISIDNVFCRYNNDDDNTPMTLNANLSANDIPITLYINFNSPICEWFFIVFGEKKIAIYDFFKDILIVIDNDDQHLSKNVINTALQYFIQFWKGFFINGIQYMSNNLFYGHDIVIKNFIDAINTKQQDVNISSQRGLEVVEAMNNIVELSNKKRIKYE